MSSMRVSSLLASKGSQAKSVYAAGPGDSVYSALELMAQRNVGALVVLDEGRLVGIVSERDYARKVILRGLSSREVKVADLMTREVVTVAPEDTVGACMQRMNEHRIRHLPVVDGERVMGVISIVDVLAAIVANQAFEIEQLQGYIGGSIG